MEKQCTKCGQAKLLTEFPGDKRHRDGKSSWCRLCKHSAIARYQKAHPEKGKAASRRWQTENPDKEKEYKRKRDAKRRNIPKGKLNNSMSCALRRSLKGKSKSRRHWEGLVGFTVDQLKKHLEKKFKPGMDWENYGKYWHIDHKTPQAAFNFERPEDLDFKRCWALKNLQPMEAKQNMGKGAKVENQFQPSFSMGI